MFHVKQRSRHEATVQTSKRAAMACILRDLSAFFEVQHAETREPSYIDCFASVKITSQGGLRNDPNRQGPTKQF